MVSDNVSLEEKIENEIKTLERRIQGLRELSVSSDADPADAAAHLSEADRCLCLASTLQQQVEWMRQALDQIHRTGVPNIVCQDCGRAINLERIFEAKMYRAQCVACADLEEKKSRRPRRRQ